MTLSGDRKVYSVSELSREVKSLIEGSFTPLMLEGELSEYKVYPSGHAYFSIKDEKAVIRAMMWKGKNALLKFTPKAGDKVLIRCKPTIYERSGQYQIVVDSMEPTGLGALQAAFEELKQKLAAEGLFDRDKKRPLPRIAWTVGIVTSPTGAVIQDMIRTINRRFPGLHIVFAPVPVQGVGSAKKIASAIKALNKHGQADVIIVGRGGGSLEDLWAFNEEVVARAIFTSKIPVVSAVGHETDFTIADFVADLRASTPTAAAEQIAPPRADLEERIEGLAEALVYELKAMTQSYAQEVDELGERALRAVKGRTAHVKQSVRGVVRHLGALSPKNRLANMQVRHTSAIKGLLMGARRTGETRRSTLREFLVRLGAASPISRLDKMRYKHITTAKALNKGVLRINEIRASRLRELDGKLHTISPLAALERGYSIITSPDGRKVYSSVAQLSAGGNVKIRMSDGTADAMIRGKNKPKQEELF